MNQAARGRIRKLAPLRLIRQSRLAIRQGDPVPKCVKCGHDAFNGRYCEADDPAFQTRHVPCGCKCVFATAAPMEQPGTLMQAISFCNHLAEHVTQELTEQSDNPQRDILNYEDYRKGQIQAAVEIRDRLQQLVSNADEGTR